ncbi:MAG: HDOD domain-containing protein [Nitrospira sp.]|jgi:HD-like signal output (HDOD) protein|nr:HDOD domain-containing protein [Nitrospira sp.]
MSSSSLSSEVGIATTLKPRLHQALQPLCDESTPCLPALEKTCQKILTLTGELTGADQLGRLISRDPALTCKVLQIANSIAYSPQQVITSVPHAVSWLGLDTVRSIVTAAQLVEQLNQWPARQHIVSGVIARALVAAVHASELGTAIEYHSPSQLFSAALLYSVGDLAVSNQAPDLYVSLRNLAQTHRTPAARDLEETTLLGVPRLRLSQALAQLWGLPPFVIDLFSTEAEKPEGRWQTSNQIFKGLVTGSAALIEAMTGPAGPLAVESAKRALLSGTGLPPQLFGDLLVRALDRGKQLVLSAGLSFDLWSDATEPMADRSAQTPSSATAGTDNTPHRGPSAIETNPMETLQALQAALRETKDLNTLLGTLVRALHRDGGFARVALALLNPNDSDQLIGRLLLGVEQPAPYLGSLSGSLTKEHPYFLSLVKRAEPSLVEDFSKPMSHAVSPDFLRVWAPSSAIIAPLRVGTRPIGMIYGDNGPAPGRVLSKDLQAFQLFFSQTTLSMNRLAGVL